MRQAVEAERGHGEALEHLRVEVVQHCHTAAKLQREQRRQARAAARLEHGRAARAEGSVARTQLMQEVDRALPELEAALVSSWHEIRGAHGRREAGRVCEQFRNPRLGHDRLSKLGEAAHRAPFCGSTSRRGVACCRMAGGAGARPHRLYWPAARVNLLVERHLSRLHQLGCGRAGGLLAKLNSMPRSPGAEIQRIRAEIQRITAPKQKEIPARAAKYALPPSRSTAALRTPPPADSAPVGEAPKNVLKAAADGRVGEVRLWLNDGGKADTLFNAESLSTAKFHAPC